MTCPPFLYASIMDKIKYIYRKVVSIIPLVALIAAMALFAACFAREAVKSDRFRRLVLKREPSEIFYKKNIAYPFTFIAYGDSREPAGDEREKIITRIIEEKPSFVVHLGDMVREGTVEQWAIFDDFDGRIMDSAIPFYPVLGNHELYDKRPGPALSSEEKLSHFFKRFPFLEGRHWYSFRYGNSRFLMLDTNIDYSPGSPQYDWLLKELKKQAPGFLFAAFHHPPYTKCSGKEARAAEKVLSGVFESYEEEGLIKADIVFAAHVHNYERYRYNGINYVVSAGGGAPQYAVDRDDADFYASPGDTFHFCRVTVSESEVAFEMVRLDEDTGGWTVADSFIAPVGDLR